jgi:uncharacterized membrane-anchored protein YjiN (DUF445 family)
MLAPPSVAQYLGELWRALKEALRDGGSQAEIRQTLAEGITRFGAALLDDEAVLDTLNRRLRGLLTEIAGRHGADLGRLISETIRSWDTRTVVEKLEQNVGPDLQYIRINGTLIGGLIGLTIHQLTTLLT